MYCIYLFVCCHHMQKPIYDCLKIKKNDCLGQPRVFWGRHLSLP